MSNVLGIGNALVDILTQINDDNILTSLSLPKGSMQLVNNNVAADVIAKTNHLKREQTSGGSAANTIHGLASLGISTGFIGKVGNDELGNFFRDDMIKNNIDPKLLLGNNPTGNAIALISPDSERTFATYLGAAIELSESDLKDKFFNGYKYFHIEGYLVQNKELIRKALIMAKNHKMIVSLDLASFNVVESNIEFLKEMANEYVDILFANEEEAKSFTGKTEEEALNEMSCYCNISVLKIGKRGSLIKHGNDIYRIKATEQKAIDTTGAGDLYAAGFLYGMIHKLDLNKCGNIGSIVSGHVIEVIGPKINNKTWNIIKKDIAKL
ncbi:MAG: adenosine kinase [Bacteroidales bacterium]|nr:adenosine kinase [Bacteroidales bacterium]